MPDALEVILYLRNLQQFVAGNEEAATSVKGVGEAAETSGKKSAAGWKGMVKWAAGAAAVYGGVRFLKSAVDSTNELAKATLQQQRITGQDTQTASEWVALTKERGIATNKFQMGMVRLSKTIDQARGGTEKESQTIKALRQQIDEVAAAGGTGAPKEIAKLSNAILSAQNAGVKARQVMEQLGVPLREIQKGTTNETLLKVADAFQRMRDPAERAALAQKLFGRGGVALLPVLAQGSAGVQKLLEQQKKAGNYLSGQGLKQTMDNIRQQRELSAALAGVRVQLALAVMPALISLGKGLVWFAQLMRPVTSNAKIMRVVLIGLIAAFVAYQVVTKAAAVNTALATLAIEEWTIWAKIAQAVTKAWTVVQWLFNAALDANPIGLIVIGIVALIAVIALVIWKWKWFKQVAVDAIHAIVVAARFVWNWIKTNWPLLVGIMFGPFGLAVALIITHFKLVEKVALEVVDTIKNAIEKLVNWVKSIPAKIGHTLQKIPGMGAALKAAGAVSSVGSSIAGVFQHGGTASVGGHYLVGERGPELVSLPSGATVTPLSGVAPIGGLAGGGGGLVIEVPVYLDRAVLARAVAQVTADKLARR
jgi:hypothetical protein